MAFPSLRVSQFDAATLDSEILRLVWQQLCRVRDSLPINLAAFLSRFEPEFQVCLHSVLWFYSVRQKSATLGQDTMSMRYFPLGTDGSVRQSNLLRTKLRSHYALSVLLPYAMERCVVWLRYLVLDDESAVKMELIMRRVTLGWRIVTLVNLCSFLMKGGQRTLLERCMGWRAAHIEQPQIGTIDLSNINRELLWHGFGDFLLFLLPLINVRRIWRLMHRKQAKSDSKTPIDLRSSLSNCASCQNAPILPYSAGCEHVYCYYCISANLMANRDFRCSACDRRLKFEFIKSVRLEE